MEYKISSELTPQEVDQIITRKDPPLRKPVQMAKNVGTAVVGGALAAGSALANLKPRTDSIKTITI